MKTHNVPGAPAAIGPYCHAVRTGHLVFCSGQTPIDPTTNQLIEGSISDQTQRVLDNIAVVLGGLGLTLQDVVKTTVFLKDMGDFEEMNATYAACFAGHTPARTTIAIRQNPLDARIEIECIAEVKEEG